MQTDQAYRRGTILGLTIAEVFILLVFLLLLTLLLFMNQWEKKMAEEEILREETETVRQVLSVWEEPGNLPTPEEVKTLHDRANEAEAELRNIEEDSKMARKRADAAEQEIVKLKDQLENAGKEKMDDEKEIADLKKAHQEVQEILEDANKKLQKARRDLRIQKKGENPPCWYKLKVENGKTREQHLFLLNIAVFDDAMIIRRRKPPEGAAVDDGGEPYAIEAQRLPLADIPYGEPLKDETLRENLQPIYDMGKAAEVRTYPCKFSVLVWDKTSSGAKARWQQAHDEVLEGLFGTVRVKQDPWPGG